MPAPVPTNFNKMDPDASNIRGSILTGLIMITPNIIAEFKFEWFKKKQQDIRQMAFISEALNVTLSTKDFFRDFCVNEKKYSVITIIVNF